MTEYPGNQQEPERPPGGPPGWVTPGGAVPPQPPPPAGSWVGPAGAQVPPADSYGALGVFLWAVLAVIVMLPLSLIVQVVALGVGGSLMPDNNSSAAVGFAILGLAVSALPIAFAIVMLRRASSKRAAAPWLGIIIGASLYLLLFAGVCVPLISSGM